MPKTQYLLKLFQTKKYFLISGIVLLILFVVFTILVRADLLRSFDFDTTVRIQDDTPLKFDDFFSILSVVGRFDFTFPLLIILLIIKRKLLGTVAVFLFGMAHVIELIGKSILEQPGPPRMFLRSHFSDFPGLHVFTDASYPSGHSLRIVFLAILFTYSIYKFKIPLAIKIGLYSIIAFLTTSMLWSRVSLGEHWTTDVIGGSLLGASIAFLSLVFL